MDCLMQQGTHSNPALKLVVAILVLSLPIMGFAFGVQYGKSIGQANVETTTCVNCNTLNSTNKPPSKNEESNTFDLKSLSFPALPPEYAFNVKQDEDYIDRIYITVVSKESDATLLTVRAYPIKTEKEKKYSYRYDLYQQPTKQSKFSDITFLGTKYPLFVEENAIQGDGPALNPGDCSNSLVGHIHSATTKEDVVVSFNETMSTSSCNGQTYELSSPSQEGLKVIYDFIGGIKKPNL